MKEAGPSVPESEAYPRAGTANEKESREEEHSADEAGGLPWGVEQLKDVGVFVVGEI